MRVDLEMCRRAWIWCYAVATVGGAVGWARDGVPGMRGRVGLSGMESRGQAQYGFLASLLTRYFVWLSWCRSVGVAGRQPLGRGLRARCEAPLAFHGGGMPDGLAQSWFSAGEAAGKSHTSFFFSNGKDSQTSTRATIFT